MFELLLWSNLLLGALIIYHHVGYPVLLKIISRKNKESEVVPVKRKFESTLYDQELPSVQIIMPAFNEEAFISEKIRNLATLDYPVEKLTITLICDGCQDKTAKIARETLKEPEVSHLRLEVIEHKTNRGKVAVVNEAVLAASADIVALSDVSALVSIDALLIAVAHFKQDAIGVVSGTYSLLNPGSEGEASYWKYQTAIKKRESMTGSTLGVHGAFYLFRRELFEPLPLDTINDDFVLPMLIVGKKYRAVYEPGIIAVELEKATESMNINRRKRIAAGNVQQLIKLYPLLNPKYQGVAFNFFSGKTLRVMMPVILLLFLFSSIVLMVALPVYGLLVLAQLLVYGIAVFRHFKLPKPVHRIVDIIHYLVFGHIANLVGLKDYIAGKHKSAWKRVTTFEEPAK